MFSMIEFDLGPHVTAKLKKRVRNLLSLAKQHIEILPDRDDPSGLRMIVDEPFGEVKNKVAGVEFAYLERTYPRVDGKNRKYFEAALDEAITTAKAALTVVDKRKVDNVVEN